MDKLYLYVLIEKSVILNVISLPDPCRNSTTFTRVFQLLVLINVDSDSNIHTHLAVLQPCCSLPHSMSGAFSVVCLCFVLFWLWTSHMHKTCFPPFNNLHHGHYLYSARYFCYEFLCCRLEDTTSGNTSTAGCKVPKPLRRGAWAGSPEKNIKIAEMGMKQTEI